MPEITIIIPSRNRSSLLGKTLESLMDQLHRDFDVIVVDHGSTDNTRNLCASYQERLTLDYHRLEHTKAAPGMARDYGARHAKSSVIAFLDAGILVPTFYTLAHADFHRLHSHHVGVGMYHGHTLHEPQDHRWLSLLASMSVDDAGRVGIIDPDLRDARAELSSLADLQLPWLYGWGGNLSMHLSDYLTTGGFDLDHEYGFEDLDLSYKLFKCGLTFAFVNHGWGIHLPHPRPSLEDLQRMDFLGWRRSYRKQRSLSLEVSRYAMYNARPGAIAEHGAITETSFTYLSKLGQIYKQFSPLPSSTLKLSEPALLIGGSERDAHNFAYVALADDHINSTNCIWSCAGILIPLPDQSLATVAVSDMWKWLGFSFEGQTLSLLECLILEVKRTAYNAVFVNSNAIASPPNHRFVTTAELEELCHKHNLAVQIIS